MTLPKNHQDGDARGENQSATQLSATQLSDTQLIEPPLERFWEEKPMEAMNEAEWEALCDGCGRCCLVVLIDEETDDIHETDVACRLYDPNTRQCCDYANRAARVPDCVTLTPETARTLSWMPPSCAYRRLARGEGLPEWHPLLTGTRQSVVAAGVATSRTLLSEDQVRERDLPGRVRALRWGSVAEG